MHNLRNLTGFLLEKFYSEIKVKVLETGFRVDIHLNKINYFKEIEIKDNC